MSVVYVAAGGALGALARYGLSGWVQTQVSGTFPWGTLTVNVLGSFLLGVAVAWLASSAVTPETREFLTIGILGAFTTFSTFTYETVALIREGDWLRAGSYLTGSLVLGLVALAAGLALAAWLLQPRIQP